MITNIQSADDARHNVAMSILNEHTRTHNDVGDLKFFTIRMPIEEGYRTIKQIILLRSAGGRRRCIISYAEIFQSKAGYAATFKGDVMPERLKTLKRVLETIGFRVAVHIDTDPNEANLAIAW